MVYPFVSEFLHNVYKEVSTTAEKLHTVATTVGEQTEQWLPSTLSFYSGKKGQFYTGLKHSM